MSRLLAEGFAVRKNAGGKLGFPFVKRRRARSAQILLYHRINDESDRVFPAVPTRVFARQMEYVAENYIVCSLGEMVERLRSNDLPPNLLAITFDDGYRDNFTHAFPVLRRLGLPATIFLATDAIGTGRVLWQDRVFAALRETRATVLENFPGDGAPIRIGGYSDRQGALIRILKFLWSLEEGERSAWVDKVIRQLGVQNRIKSDGLMLNWEDVRHMSQRGITFGSHTVTHPVLSKISLQRAREEIRASKTIIESNLQAPVKHFAYPVGRREDFTDEIKKEVRAAGFESAVTTIFGVNDSRQDLLELRRATPWDHDIDAFALQLSYIKFAS
ncbi:MAG TPA: polysaccharide deacetylase family protein [Candidatus Binatia bacterium]|nr:polysaccharide deacetylase family protein [Candidatus Binatia bacterium]